jgi:uncharacterized membrane protein (GlpM family)
MKLLLAVTSWILIALLVFQNQLIAAGVLTLVFTFYFGALAIVCLALAIDAYFGAFMNVPYFSIVTLLWYVFSELIRLRMRIME